LGQEDFPIHRRAAAIAVISSAVLFLIAWTSAGALARSTERTALSIAKAKADAAVKGTAAPPNAH
jgi:hypothetical protein